MGNHAILPSSIVFSSAQGLFRIAGLWPSFSPLTSSFVRVLCPDQIPVEISFAFVAQAFRIDQPLRSRTPPPRLSFSSSPRAGSSLQTPLCFFEHPQNDLGGAFIYFFCDGEHPLFYSLFPAARAPLVFSSRLARFPAAVFAAYHLRFSVAVSFVRLCRSRSLFDLGCSTLTNWRTSLSRDAFLQRSCFSLYSLYGVLRLGL